MSVPTNEEIIDDITKDLNSQHIKSESEDPCKNDTDDESEQSESQPDPVDPADFIDELALKDLEITLTPEEKLQRVTKSIELKNQGNTLFKEGNYIESLKLYTEGLNLCPLSSPLERSMLYSNRAAAKAKLDRNELAIEDCSEAIKLDEKYVRAYLRRAQLYEITDKLDQALADYKIVLELDPSVAAARKAVATLPAKIEERNEQMKTEMMGKLKDLGNLILKPFGLSTENFNLQQDPNTGGYSVNFNQNKSN